MSESAPSQAAHSRFVEKAFFYVVGGVGSLIITIGLIGVSVLRDMSESIDSLNKRMASVVETMKYTKEIQDRQSRVLKTHSNRLSRLESSLQSTDE